MKVIKKIKVNKKLSSNEERRIKEHLKIILFGDDYFKIIGLIPNIDPQIHLIQIKKSKTNKLTIEITTSRPGILIGKQGKTINYLEKELSERLGNVDIELIEFDPFL